MNKSKNETKSSKKSPRWWLIAIVAVVLVASIVAVLWIVGRSQCKFIAPTGQCYTQETIDKDNARSQACREQAVRDNPELDINDPDVISGCAVAR
jgi:flagellar basal body-associated protein FliL